MPRRDDIVLNQFGTPVPGATVRVCTDVATGTPCSPLASIFSNDGLSTPLTNPTTTDANGNYFFYAAIGEYQIQISGPNITTVTFSDVVVPPSTAAGSGTVTNTLGALTNNVLIKGHGGSDVTVSGITDNGTTISTSETLDLTSATLLVPETSGVLPSSPNQFLFETLTSNAYLNGQIVGIWNTNDASTITTGDCVKLSRGAGNNNLTLVDSGHACMAIAGDLGGTYLAPTVAKVNGGTPGGSCTNQVVTGINTSAQPSCSTLTLASAFFANQGTATTVLHGNAAGNPSFGPVALATDVSGQLPIGAVGSAGLSGTSPVAIAATGAISCPTCATTSSGGAISGTSPITVSAGGAIGCATCTTSAAALTSNQLVIGGGGQAESTLGSLGTTTTLLHGNASGAPSFTSVVQGDVTNGYVDLSSTQASVGGAKTFTTGITTKTLNNSVYASQFSGADAAAKVAAAVTALGGPGTVFIDFTGNQTWGSTITATSGVDYIFVNCATYDATSLTTSPFFQSSAPGGGWRFVGAGPGDGGAAGSGCTVFNVAQTSGPNINIADAETIELGNFTVQKFSNSGGDVIDAAYMQSAFVHDIYAYSKASGKTWVNGIVLNCDANGSSIYNIFQNIHILPFGTGVGSVSGNCFSIIGGTGGKVTNQNLWKQLVCGGHAGSVVGLNVSGGATSANENIVIGADLSGNATGVNLAASSARNMWLQVTAENNSGTGVAIAAGNLYTKCFGCEITGNGTQVSDSGTASFWQANITGLTPLGVTPSGSIVQASGNGIGMDGASAISGSLNMPSGDTLAAAGTNVVGLLTTLTRFYKPLELDEQAAPSGLAGEDFIWADSTAHKLKANNNNGGAVTFGYIDAAQTWTAAQSFNTGDLIPNTVQMPEIAAPSGVAAADVLWADSTAHEIKANLVNGGAGLVNVVRPSPINQTGKTAAISTATLCASSAGNCNVAGQYRVDWNFWGSGTACSSVTAGSVTFLLTWTDENAVTHSAVAMQMQAQTGAATTAMQASFPFQTTLANESASGSAIISTNGSVIQYATGYTACTTGTGTYNLRASVTRVQ